MAFNFPDSPVEGQQFIAPAGPVYQYVGGKWTLMGGSAAPAPLSSFRNLIQNGDFRVDQRLGAVTTVGAGVTAPVVDRWWVGSGQAPGAFNVGRIADAYGILGFNVFSVGVSVADASLAAADWYAFGQVIEGLFCQDLAWGSTFAKPITISFTTSCTINCTLSLALRNAPTYNRVWLGTFNTGPATGRVVMTVPGDQTGTWGRGNSYGIALSIGLAAGTSYSGASGGWQAGNLMAITGTTNFMAAANSVYVGDFQVEIGTVATEFERVPYDTQLARCQRYYQRTGGGNGWAISGYGTAGGSFYNTIVFPVTMRAAPTMVKSGTWNAANCGQPSLSGIDSYSALIGTVVIGAGAYIVISDTADDVLTFNAEL